MNTKSLTRRSAETRAKLMQKYGESGLTQKAFCEAEGIKTSTFQNWLRAKPKRPAFTEVTAAAAAQATTVEFLFPDGTAVRIRSA